MQEARCGFCHAGRFSHRGVECYGPFSALCTASGEELVVHPLFLSGYSRLFLLILFCDELPALGGVVCSGETEEDDHVLSCTNLLFFCFFLLFCFVVEGLRQCGMFGRGRRRRSSTKAPWHREKQTEDSDSDCQCEIVSRRAVGVRLVQSCRSFPAENRLPILPVFGRNFCIVARGRGHEPGYEEAGI